MTATALLSLLCAAAWARERPGVTAAPVLQVPVGARAVGMGTAFTAVADDLSTLHYNPAGLTALSRREISFMYLSGLDDHSLEHVAFGSPLPLPGLFGGGFATAGGALLFSQSGSIEVNRTNPDGSLLDSRSMSAGGDLVATFGYAERIMETALESPRLAARINHFGGISGKLIRSTLAQDYSATAAAADAGYLAASPDLGWSAGASILNLGTKMTFVEEGDPLPLTLRAGGAWRVVQPGLRALTIASDGDYLFYERQWRVNAGVEVAAVLYPVAGRLGYRFHHDTAGLTFGFGARWKGWAFDYAWAMSSAVDDTHRFSFTYRFGSAPLRGREKLQGGSEIGPGTYDRPPSPRRTTPSQEGTPAWIY